jgi:predicted metal-dependent HD superfamily phosphohydrolase
MHESSILNKVEKYVGELLSDFISEEKLYHNLQHTLEVVEVSTEIALAEDLITEEVEIVKIAAWFHDIGYVTSWEEHEKESANYAHIFLGKKSYPVLKVEKIIGCIIATKLPQSPKNKMEEILCDADLHHLGLPDMDEKGNLLRREIEINERRKISDIEWLRNTMQLLTSHKYFTDYAKRKFNNQKEINFLNLKTKLELLERIKN